MPTPQPPPAPPPLPAAPRTPVIPHHPWPQSTAPPAEAPQYPQPPISCAFGPAASVAVATSLRQFGGSQPPSRSRCLPLFAAVAIVASVLGTAPVPSAPAAFSSPDSTCDGKVKSTVIQRGHRTGGHGTGRILII
ncbi:hypothetical protein BS78_05G135300 [Paspalum vaginatum]|nr:hypothetical protein BS78_05G135300 [Paspalum vaginatum]